MGCCGLVAGRLWTPTASCIPTGMRSRCHALGGALSCSSIIAVHRVDAFTCWSVASGAKTYNYGSRIDLILLAGPALPDAPPLTLAIDPHTHEDKHAPQANRSQDAQRAKPVTHAAMLRAAREGDARITLTGAASMTHAWMH